MSAIMDSLPPALRLDLACAMNHSLFAKVRAALAASLDEGVLPLRISANFLPFGRFVVPRWQAFHRSSRRVLSGVAICAT